MQDIENNTGAVNPPDSTLMTISTVSAILEITRRVLTLMDGKGAATLREAEGNAIERMVYAQLMERAKGVN